jgi:hypothetical protein
MLDTWANGFESDNQEQNGDGSYPTESGQKDHRLHSQDQRSESVTRFDDNRTK